MAVSERDRATSGRGLSSPPFTPKDFARDVAPLVAASVTMGTGIIALRRNKPTAALRAARFVNLMLASLLAGNGVGGERFVHAPLRQLQSSQYLEAERAITRSYLPMLALMPRRRGISFWLTAAGTLGMLGVFATTLVEIPLNRETLMASSENPGPWLRIRRRWERFNHLRTAWEVAG